MTTESSRVTSTRRLRSPDADPTAPTSDSDIIIEVIDQITFIDPAKQYQEVTWAFDNSDQETRKTHAVVITGSDDGSKISVERVDAYSVIDPADHYQETVTTLDNGSEDRFALDYSAASGDARVTHDVKIWSKDGSSWVLVRRTDSFRVVHGSDRQYWEIEFALDNRDHDAGNPPPDDLDAPITAWDGTTINPPWRLDPFQNIVDVSWSGLAVVFYDGAT